ncbi:MAG: hypothetical protein FD129_2031, partial [bacterium]
MTHLPRLGPQIGGVEPVGFGAGGAQGGVRTGDDHVGLVEGRVDRLAEDRHVLAVDDELGLAAVELE